MNKRIFKYKRLSHGLFLGFSSLLVISIAGGAIADKNSNAINKALHIDTSRKDNTGDEYFKTTYKTEDDVKRYFKDTAIEAENDGLVLLKNSKISTGEASLPISKTSKVTLLGTASYRFNYNTSGSSSTSSSSYQTFPNILKEKGIEVNPDTESLYTNTLKGEGRTIIGNSYLINEPGYDKVKATLEKSIANYSDAAIITIARESGEGKDLSTSKSDGEDGSYLSLSESELDLLANLTSLKKEGKVKRIIVLLNSSNPIEQDYLYRENIDVDSVLWIGNVGSYGLNAVVETLIGENNPSGRLSDTYCRDNFSSPAMTSWGLNRSKSLAQYYTNYSALKLDSTQRSYEIYNEGIYLGYRYYETRYEDKIMGKGNAGDYNYENDVAFPFGYGLSYTTFEYSNYKVEAKDDSFLVSLDVTNIGNMDGKHTVEIYMQKPYTDYDKANHVEKASVELVGYQKTGVLKANGGKETVTIEIQKSQMKSYDSYGYKTYIVDEGDYYLTAGRDAHNATDNILKKKGYQTDGTDSLVYSYHVSTLDHTTYSKDETTGMEITNQLDDSDMNLYEGKGNNKVTYMSRNDWTGTWPKAPISFTIETDKMKDDIKSDKAIVETETEMPKYEQPTDLKLISLKSFEEKEIAYDDKKWDELLDSMSFGQQARLVTSGQNATIALSKIGLPGIKALDGPTAVVETKTDSAFPSEGIWASTFNNELISKIGDAFAEDIRLSGTEGSYAPGVNLHRTPFIGRSNEYFSEDSFLTSQACVAEINALQKKGVITHTKHFAFNDCETNRNGISVWLNEQEARELLLAPFEAAVKKGHTGSIMSSFNRVGCRWVGAHNQLQQNILCKEWGFTGYIITDMAVSNGGSYMLYNDGFMNGSNLFMGSGTEKSLDAYKSSPTFAWRVRESTHRILYTIVNKSAGMNGISPDSTLEDITPWWKVTLTTVSIVSGIISGIAFVYYMTSYFLIKEK